MSKLLTEDQRRSYRENGFVFPVAVLSDAEVRTYRGECDELEVQLGGKPRTIEVRQMHLHFLWAFALATHPRILDAVEDLLGPDLLVWATELFAKHPHDPAISVGWHRDQPYMGFDGNLTVTAWVALSNSTRQNGGLQVLVEPDRREKCLTSCDHRGHLSAAPAMDASAVVQVELQAGEMSLHDPFVLHGSNANLSGEKRVGFAIRFMTPVAKPLAGRAPVVLARGKDRFNHFLIVDPPREAQHDLAISSLKQSATQLLDDMIFNLKHINH